VKRFKKGAENILLQAGRGEGCVKAAKLQKRPIRNKLSSQKAANNTSLKKRR
jgi:hypothetical protein